MVYKIGGLFENGVTNIIRDRIGDGFEFKGKLFLHYDEESDS